MRDKPIIKKGAQKPALELFKRIEHQLGFIQKPADGYLATINTDMTTNFEFEMQTARHMLLLYNVAL